MKKDLYDKLPDNDDIQRVLREGLEAYKVDITGDKSPDFRTRFLYLQEVLELKGYKNGSGVKPYLVLDGTTLSEESKTDDDTVITPETAYTP